MTVPGPPRIRIIVPDQLRHQDPRLSCSRASQSLRSTASRTGVAKMRWCHAGVADTTTHPPARAYEKCGTMPGLPARLGGMLYALRTPPKDQEQPMNRRELVAALAERTRDRQAPGRGQPPGVHRHGHRHRLVGRGRGDQRLRQVRPLDRPARMGRNPQTGEAIRIKASRAARVTPLKTFKDAVLTGKRAAKKAEEGTRPGRPRPRRRPWCGKAPARKAPARKKTVAKKTHREEDDKKKTTRRSPNKKRGKKKKWRQRVSPLAPSVRLGGVRTRVLLTRLCIGLLAGGLSVGARGRGRPDRGRSRSSRPVAPRGRSAPGPTSTPTTHPGLGGAGPRAKSQVPNATSAAPTSPSSLVRCCWPSRPCIGWWVAPQRRHTIGALHRCGPTPRGSRH